MWRERKNATGFHILCHMLEVLLREFICLVARYKHGANVLEFCVKANPVVTFSVDKTSFVSGAGLHRL